MGKIISISNKKGGCGKTTTTINLAASLNMFNQSCLLIDMDSQGSLTKHYDLRKHKDDIYSLLKTKNFKPYQKDELLSVIPSSLRTDKIITEFRDELGKELYLKDMLDIFRDQYDYILIDCPAQICYLTDLAYTASDGLLIPVSTDRYSIEGLAELSQRVNLIKKLYNPNLAYYGILLTNAKTFTNAYKTIHTMAEEITAYIATNVYPTVIRSSTVVQDAQNEFKTLLQYKKNAPVTLDYLSFTKEFMERGKNE